MRNAYVTNPCYVDSPQDHENTMSLSDRRRHPRFPFHSRASLQLDDSLHQGTLLDVSLKGGLFVPDAKSDVSAGRECRLKVFNGGVGRFFALDGSIVHFHEHLIGIEFKPVSGESLRWFQQVIELNLAIPELMQRDLPALLGR